ncbi:MAG: DUF92 domain-containing protein [Gemmatimonadetes bacterium]|nr:DUF92 domain-containing protein [Gemmatimonadota bacterium]
MSLGAAVGLAVALALAGYAVRWLSLDGTIAAATVGAAVLAGVGPAGAAPLALFFVSGSALTALNRRRGLLHPETKGGPRDARQVLANGLWAAVGALIARREPSAGWALLTGALAAAQSDTWATELGARARIRPRLITTGQSVPPGTSGGVTVLGTAGGVAGALLLIGTALVAGAPGRAAAAGLVGGILGMLADSALGASVQARFRCDGCGDVTERAVHRCGRAARPLSGWPWLDNDAVNLLGTGAGGATALLLSSWFWTP